VRQEPQRLHPVSIYVGVRTSPQPTTVHLFCRRPASRGIPCFLCIFATGIHASRKIPHFLCIFATGIHASRGIPHFLYITATGIPASRGIPHFLYITATGIPASRGIPHFLYITATGIPASRGIPHILCIFATGIHASRKIPHFLCIKKAATWSRLKYVVCKWDYWFFCLNLAINASGFCFLVLLLSTYTTVSPPGPEPISV